MLVLAFNNRLNLITLFFFESAWRHRLPNDEENLTVWDEIFTWRAHMFNAITTNFRWSEPSTLATLHDRPWTGKYQIFKLLPRYYVDFFSNIHIFCSGRIIWIFI